ncbi:hypothetical protein C8Q78DRAFT_994489 [Trametes maxima]|nr:hypothetical protein C8Q78DRAFT_994489 [Trametes maxima]
MPLQKADFPAAYAKWREVTNVPCGECNDQTNAATFKCYRCYKGRRSGCLWRTAMMKVRVRGEAIGSRAPTWWREAMNSPSDWGVTEHEGEDDEDEDEMAHQEDTVVNFGNQPRMAKKLDAAAKTRGEKISKLLARKAGGSRVCTKKCMAVKKTATSARTAKSSAIGARTAKSSTIGARTTKSSAIGAPTSTVPEVAVATTNNTNYKACDLSAAQSQVSVHVESVYQYTASATSSAPPTVSAPVINATVHVRSSAPPGAHIHIIATARVQPSPRELHDKEVVVADRV